MYPSRFAWHVHPDGAYEKKMESRSGRFILCQETPSNKKCVKQNANKNGTDKMRPIVM